MEAPARNRRGKTEVKAIKETNTKPKPTVDLTSSGVDLLAFSSSDGVTVDGAASIIDIQ